MRTSPRFYLGIAPHTKHAIEIEADRYELIKLHKANLIFALGIEEDFDCVLANYVELEEELLTMTLKNVVVVDRLRTNLPEVRRRIGRRFANFLLSATRYLKHLEPTMVQMYRRGSPELSKVKGEIDHCQNTSVSFRLMQELRDYDQHQGAAVRSVSAHLRRISSPDHVGWSCTMIPGVRKSDLLNRKRLQFLTESDIAGLPETIELKDHFRLFMACIAHIQAKIRAVIDDGALAWETTIRDAIEQFERDFGVTKPHGLAIFRIEDVSLPDGAEKHDLFCDFIDDFRHLREVNQVGTGLESRFVTGAPVSVANWPVLADQSPAE